MSVISRVPRLLRGIEILCAVLFFCRLGGIAQDRLPSLAVLVIALAIAHAAEAMWRRHLRDDLRRAIATRWFEAGVVGLFVLTCAIRMTGLNAELGHVPLGVDENRLASSVQHYFATGELLHGTVEHHPGLAFWLFAAAAFVSFVHHLANGVLVQPSHVSVELIVAAARITNVFVAGATVVFTAMIARRIAGSTAGLFAGLLVAIAPLSIQSVECRCDPVMLVLVLAAVYLALIACDRQTRGWFIAAGAIGGAAAGVKYSGAFVLVTVLLSTLSVRPPRARLASALAVLIAFVTAVAATNHFVWSDTPNFLRQLYDQVFITGAGHWAATANPRAFYVDVLDRFGPGAGLLVVAAVFGVCTLVSRRLDWWIVCSFPVVYMAIMTGRPSQFPRWVYPMVPFVAIAASASLALARARMDSWSVASAQRRVLARSALVAAVTFLLVQPVWSVIVELSRRMASPTHVLAEDWIRTHAAPGAVVMVENGWLNLADSGLRLRRVGDLRLVLDGGLAALEGIDWVIVPEPSFGHPFLRQLGFAGRIHVEQRLGAGLGYDYDFYTVPRR